MCCDRLACKPDFCREFADLFLHIGIRHDEAEGIGFLCEQAVLDFGGQDVVDEAQLVGFLRAEALRGEDAADCAVEFHRADLYPAAFDDGVRGHGAFEAACYACYRHGQAADQWTQPSTLTAADLARQM